MTVKNQQGDTLGEIEELMVDVQDGRVAYAALDVGGWFDIGGKKYVAVPWNALKPNPDTKTITLNVDKDKLRQAPSFARGSWPDAVERVWLVQVHNFYGVSPYPELQAVTAERVTVARASALMDMDVGNGQGQDLGKIEDLVVAFDNGHIIYAVLAYGGWLGLGENMAAVPWKALKLNPAEQTFTLNIDKEKLRDAPHFAKTQWPQTVDPQWLANVYAFYGERPDRVVR
jgi:sporulation protein YlmC with PRC-barrel domain